ncbi:MAG: PAS domain-containing protein [Bacteroidales bacterium]|nr:PAS domain-containing protein [Bacteroidales bacterium]
MKNYKPGLFQNYYDKITDLQKKIDTNAFNKNTLDTLNSVLSDCLEDIQNLQKQVEKESAVKLKAEETQKTCELALEAAEEGIWDWNLVTDEIYYSDQWKAQLGYNPEELANKFKTWENLLHPDDKSRMEKELSEYIKKPEGNFIAEFRLKHKNKTYRRIRNKAVSLVNDKKQVVRMIGAHTDITLQKEFEEELKEYRDHLEKIVKERTLELEEKNRQLERMNSLFVGREFRIKELRDKIRELEKKSSK